MVRLNLDRPLPIVDRRFLVTEDIQPFTDPDWEHLALVYQILRRFQDLHGRCTEVDLPFLKMLFRQLGSQDEREQTAIILTVEQFYSHWCGASLTLFFAALSSELMLWESSPNFMFAVNTALSIVITISREYPGALKNVEPMCDRIQQLLTAPSFLFFRNTFFSFVIALINFNPDLSLRFLEFALQFWPHRATAKQLCFFKLFALAIPRLYARHTFALLPRILGALAFSIRSSSARIAESAFIFLLDRGMDFFFSANVRAVITALFPAIRHACETHWSQDVREVAERAVIKFTNCDPRLCMEVVSPTVIRADTRAMQTWVRVAETAAINGYRLGRKLGEITRTFGGAGSPFDGITASASGRVVVHRGPSRAVKVALARRISDCPSHERIIGCAKRVCKIDRIYYVEKCEV
jgi:hypothetical protein